MHTHIETHRYTPHNGKTYTIKFSSALMYANILLHVDTHAPMYTNTENEVAHKHARMRKPYIIFASCSQAHTDKRTLTVLSWQQFSPWTKHRGPSIFLTIEWEITALGQIFKSFSEDPEKVRAPWTNLRLNNDGIWFPAFFFQWPNSFSG